MENWISLSKVKWDKQAENWHQRSKSMWKNGSRSKIIPFFMKHVSIGSTIVDLGCGDGYGTYLLRSQGYVATGMDFSDEMIMIAKSQEGEGLSYLTGDLMNLPLKKGEFHAALTVNSLEWTPDPLVAIGNVREILKDNGYYLASILGPTASPRKNSFDRLVGKTAVCHTMMPWEFRELMQMNGFTLIDQDYVWKQDFNEKLSVSLPVDLKEALSFSTIYLFQKS
ncbi:hypothetical protein Q73_07765 [Bacillus coahuilensis m2-6]|uniref:class I SAM-dependent methyltransferase n=1 Tax=Bacillus coahuilensis TaxID=408580 RepID=UPI0007500A96|nr:class I SAM-dependent methyltransferase [Bacillus coahuilensis]KUP07991.1 hypothetical protein Q73_07765 [Bacillus coahuilensis m2-6]